MLLYFRTDIGRLAGAWGRGLTRRDARKDRDHRLAWSVIAGSIPIGVVGLATKDLVSGPLRSLWVVATALIVWSAVTVWAERTATQTRHEGQLTLRDEVAVGLVQCVALIPGVSRSGDTISAGLLVGLDRVTATRLSFFLSIPALLAAGGDEALTEAGAVAGSVGWTTTATGTTVSFAVAYTSIAWLLRLVTHHRITVFVGYRIALGTLLLALLTTGAITATQQADTLIDTGGTHHE